MNKPTQAEIEKMLEQILNPRPYRAEISDDVQMHVIDNTASQQIGDDLMSVDPDSDSAFETDFEHDVRMHAEAYHGPDGQVLDELDQKINLREMQRAEANLLARHVNVNPPSWDSGILGSNALVNPAGTGIEPGALAGVPMKQIVHWAGEDREAIPVTITLQPNDLPDTPASSTGIVRPFARIIWGNHAGSFEADVDVAFGTQLTVTASSCYVQVGQDATADTAVRIFGALSFWAQHKHNQATRTSYFSALNGTQVFARPRFATTIAGFFRSDNTKAVTINLFDLNNNNIGQYVQAANTNFTTPIYLPNNCSAISVVTGEAETGSLIWGLSF